MTERKNLRINERIRSGEITVREGIELLKQERLEHTQTFKRLLRKLRMGRPAQRPETVTATEAVAQQEESK